MKIFYVVFLLLLSTAYGRPLFSETTSTALETISQEDFPINKFLKLQQCLFSGFGSNRIGAKNFLSNMYEQILTNIENCVQSIAEGGSTASPMPVRIEAKKNRDTNFRDLKNFKIQTTLSSAWLLKKLLLN